MKRINNPAHFVSHPSQTIHLGLLGLLNDLSDIRLVPLYEPSEFLTSAALKPSLSTLISLSTITPPLLLSCPAASGILEPAPPFSPNVGDKGEKGLWC